jgi:EAL domain-containing protein (putative c-di-GMP-specific phosphodiesterase class I)
VNIPFPGYTLDFVQSMLTEQSGRASGWFKDLELTTVFQPAFSLPHKRAFGFEASLRGASEDGRVVAPQAMFGPVDNFSETCLLDLLGTTVHVANFMASRTHGLLFLNLHPSVFLDFDHSVPFLKALFAHYRIDPRRVALDLPAYLLKIELLDAAIDAYRTLGCLISIEHLGIGNADLDSVVRTNPDIVKINHAIVAGAVTDESARQTLLHAVSMLHEMGALVLMQGVESEAEALMAIETDADFASGFYFGPLFQDVDDFDEPGLVMDGLWSRYREVQPPRLSAEARARAALDDANPQAHVKQLRSASPSDIHRYRDERRPYVSAMHQAGTMMTAGGGFEAACAEFLKLDGAIRCVLLGADGAQIGPVLTGALAPAPQSVDFSDLIEAADGNWSRRDFFRRAMLQPDIVQVTRRYRSMNGYLHCVTFSIEARVNNKPVVICGDVDWSTHESIH